MVMTIESLLSTKSRVVTETSDGWTLVGVRGNLSAQYEHTMMITTGAPIVVTRHGRNVEESPLLPQPYRSDHA